MKIKEKVKRIQDLLLQASEELEDLKDLVDDMGIESKDIPDESYYNQRHTNYNIKDEDIIKEDSNTSISLDLVKELKDNMKSILRKD